MRRQAALLLTPFICGYFLSYAFRSINAVLAPELASELSLSGSQLGLLTAVYFLSFAAFQLPLGVLLDRYGPRRVNTLLFLLAAAGSAVFAQAESFTALLAGRALIGLGVSAGLMAAFKAISQWFPAERWALLNGIMIASGGLGAAAATAPAAWLAEILGWRGVFDLLAVASLLAAALLWLAVPEHPQRASGSLGSQLRGIALVLRDPGFTALAPVVVLGIGVNMSLQGLWAGPWLRDVGGFSAKAVPDALLIIALSMTLGLLGQGLLADAAQRRGIALGKLLFWALLLFQGSQLLLICGLVDEQLWPWVLLVLSGSANSLSYAWLAKRFSLELTGRVHTALNLLIFLASFAVQALFGLCLDAWPGGDGVGWPAAAYRSTLGGLLLLQFLLLLHAGRRRATLFSG